MVLNIIRGVYLSEVDALHGYSSVKTADELALLLLLDSPLLLVSSTLLLKVHGG